jgi:hypothetical protein
MATDDKTREARIARIRGLLSKTVANGCTEAEAQTAAAMVDRLMSEYEIDLTEMEVKQQDVIKLEIGCEKHAVRFSANRIAKFTDCEVWVEPPNIVYIGLELDVDVAEYLTLLFQRAIDREASNACFMSADYALLDRTGKGEWKQSFEVGCAGRLGERLEMMKSKRDYTQKSTGFDLVAVKAPLVKAAMAQLGVVLSKEKSGGRSIKNQAGYMAGRNAADGVTISQGVTGRSGTGGRLK